MALEKEQRINHEITAPEIRLIGIDGEQAGVVSLAKALAEAEAADLDLVEIAPLAKPPVCRIMDYGKFKYHEAKKQHEAKQKQKQIQIKEIKFRPGTDEGDYQIKMRNLMRFLGDGDKVKVTLRFRGREMAHQEFGIRLIDRIKEETESIATVEQYPKLEGRQMVMMLAPKKAASVKHHPNKPDAGPKVSAAKENAMSAAEGS
ncbi:MAG: translation initiation factor IF-3 [Burkholderiales bacterium]|nr:translation initiation factor IF-3 [Burkholderiales bacterium]